MDLKRSNCVNCSETSQTHEGLNRFSDKEASANTNEVCRQSKCGVSKSLMNVSVCRIPSWRTGAKDPAAARKPKPN